MIDKNIFITLYAIQNLEGFWFRSKGYGGYGKSWVDSLNKAKIYTKIGPARSQITYWASHFPEFGIPKLIELNVTELIDAKEDERVLKAIAKKDKEKTAREIRYKEWKQEEANRKIAEAFKIIKDIK